MLILRISKNKRHLPCRILWSADITIMMLLIDALTRHGGQGA
jgi:hypothetical protein